MNSQVLVAVQIAANVVAVLTIVFAFWQVRLGVRQLRKQSDKSATEFVLNSEGQFDGMYEALFAQQASVIRLCFPNEVDASWSDEEIKKYVFLLRYYGHISRMVYLAKDRTLDIGMSTRQREELIAPWEAGLRRYANDPVMRRIHINAVRYKNYNEDMLQLSKAVFGNAE